MTTQVTVKKLELYNYKGFSRFTIHFSNSIFLVGPNNAGKSTLIHALRGCAYMIDYARAKSPHGPHNDRGNWFQVYYLPKDSFSLTTENVRHEFSLLETRIELTFSDNNKLHVVWPEKSTENDTEQGAFFYLEGKGKQPVRPADVRKAFPRIGIIPTLMPIDGTEQVLSEEHVRRNIDGRRASRHFRNQIHLLRTQGDDSMYQGYLDLVKRYTPEIELKELRSRMGESLMELDLFYREAHGRTDREIFWAGDGIQIWLQFLLHMHRLSEAPIIVLDEPDVYLHADLQRRLVRVLDECKAQTITATHSAEMLGEAGPNSITLIDRTRKRAVRAPSGDVLSNVSDAIGSQFNLRLARVLRAKAVVFVEGNDFKLLRRLASRIGATNLAAENQVAIIPLGGFSNWENVIPFQWMTSDLLQKAVPVFVILDRDYRSSDEIEEVASSLRGLNVTPLIWRRKELESYLLEVPVLERLTGAPQAWLQDQLNEIMATFENSILARTHERLVRRAPKGSQMVTITESAISQFRTQWNNVQERIAFAPPKEVLAELNNKLQSAGYKMTSFPALAQQIKQSELALEVGTNLSAIEKALTRVPFND